MNWSDTDQPVGAAAQPVSEGPLTWPAVSAVTWAGAASTIKRIRRGEGALLAVNLSLVVFQGQYLVRSVAQILVSVLALGTMYAFNDFYDAPTDSINPKKDRALIAAYLEHRGLCAAALVIGKMLTLALTLATLGASTAVMVAAVMVANGIYSTMLKGVPVIDVVWCGLWGALYAAIVPAPASLLFLVGLMTAVCHLYQTLDDRAADAANGVVTTAVRSLLLSRIVLGTLSVLLFVTLRAALGNAWALTAGVPLVLLFVAGNPRTGWLLTKLYFGVVWLYLLGVAHALG